MLFAPRQIRGALYLLVMLEGWLLCCVAERAVPASVAFLHRYTPTHIGAGHRDHSTADKTTTRLLPLDRLLKATRGELPLRRCRPRQE
ncbi:unnamed protein product [Vitrella brassicaformis CCMP3155]|uniref:Secreted protein n=1 Tax=Vitrella brassicaformis (strain CCMP3155) TaxID=1169540 RepID=A0A0G4H0K8_VITBC|nr:unnamed protein product [Vitrella brassicaformis CCMP3155]|mmetsp:Transcript_24744/g.71419  ORF Transcript_24744/g.71419 Transcript_24744/m.71419 type:complete len:88 (-) Transcript_24744:694-957(-)|eukprot:CEM37054.1 unnamed protein product [Vitrella brassicaformis CCMP3155]